MVIILSDTEPLRQAFIVACAALAVCPRGQGPERNAMRCRFEETSARSLERANASLKRRLEHMTKASSRRRFDPRVSIIVLVLMNVAVAASGEFAFSAACFAVDIAAMAWCRCWKWLAVCVAFAAFVLSVVYASTLFSGVSQGVTAAFVSLWRIVPGATFAALFIATTNLGELSCALRQTGLPTGLTVAIGVGLRFFPKAARDGMIVAEAMKSRGVSFRLSDLVKRPSRAFEAFFVPYLHRISILAGEIGNAVVSRGAESTAVRTSIYEVRLMPRDVVLLAAVCALVCALAWSKALVL